jgi:hypothetical protein
LEDNSIEESGYPLEEHVKQLSIREADEIIQVQRRKSDRIRVATQ